MRTEQNNHDLDSRVEQLLSPRFTPSAEEIKLSKPKHPARRIWLNTLRLAGVAAALAIGLFLILEPTNKVTAKTNEEVVAEALQELNKADSYRVTFIAKVKPAPVNDNDYYQLATDGEEVQGVLTLLKTTSNNGGIMRIEWESGVTQLYDGERYYEWEGTTQTDNKECQFQTLKLFALADLNTVSNIMGGEIEFKDEPNGNIRAILDSPDYARERVRIEGIFSKKSGKLIGGGSYTQREKEWIPFVKLSKVEYGFPLTTEEITTKPTR